MAVDRVSCGGGARMTVEYLLSRLDRALPLHRHLEYLRDTLRQARENGAKFYFLVLTLAGGTNARVEALRHGDLSVLATEQKPSGSDGGSA